MRLDYTRGERFAWLVIPGAALVGVLPLAVHGASCGHDFDFHVLNWLEAAAQMRGGNLHPQWAVSAAWNAGEPRFVFYPPLSWTLGAVLGMVLPWVSVPIVFTWVCLCGAGLTMCRAAGEFSGRAGAVLASTVYLLNPYMLFTAYERTAYAELLAAVWLPMLLYGVLRRRPTVAGIAWPVALLWVTNAPAAVMGMYGLAVLGGVRLVRSWRKEGRWRLARTVGAGTALGLAVAAFYIVPAAVERPLVQIAMVVIPGMRIEDNTLFHRTGVTEDALAHDAVLHTASVVAMCLLVGVAVALAAGYWQRPADSFGEGQSGEGPSGEEQREYALPCLGVVALLVGVLLTPAALPVWRHAPELLFLQFPWRFLAVLAAVLGVSGAIALRRLRWGVVPVAAVSLLLAGGLVAPSIGAFRQECDVEDTVAARVALFRSQAGSEPTDEYTPAAADNDALGHRDPPFWLAASADAKAPVGMPGPSAREFDVDVPRAQYLILNLRQYPDWHVRRNGVEVRAMGERDDGLTVIPVGAGRSHIELKFQSTPLERGADAVSVVALILLGGLRMLPGRFGRLARLS